MTVVRPLALEKEAKIIRIVAGRKAELILESSAHDSNDVRLTWKQRSVRGPAAGKACVVA